MIAQSNMSFVAPRILSEWYGLGGLDVGVFEEHQADQRQGSSGYADRDVQNAQNCQQRQQAAEDRQDRACPKIILVSALHHFPDRETRVGRRVGQ